MAAKRRMLEDKGSSLPKLLSETYVLDYMLQFLSKSVFKSNLSWNRQGYPKIVVVVDLDTKFYIINGRIQTVSPMLETFMTILTRHKFIPCGFVKNDMMESQPQRHKELCNMSLAKDCKQIVAGSAEHCVIETIYTSWIKKMIMDALCYGINLIHDLTIMLKRLIQEVSNTEPHIVALRACLDQSLDEAKSFLHTNRVIKRSDFPRKVTGYLTMGDFEMDLDCLCVISEDRRSRRWYCLAFGWCVAQYDSGWTEFNVEDFEHCYLHYDKLISTKAIWKTCERKTYFKSFDMRSLHDEDELLCMTGDNELLCMTGDEVKESIFNTPLPTDF